MEKTKISLNEWLNNWKDRHEDDWDDSNPTVKFIEDVVDICYNHDNLDVIRHLIGDLNSGDYVLEGGVIETKIAPRLNVVFDAFNEICRRLED